MIVLVGLLKNLKCTIYIKYGYTYFNVFSIAGNVESTEKKILLRDAVSALADIQIFNWFQ